jgi:hypothetical protein
MTTKYLIEKISMGWRIMKKIGLSFSMIAFIVVLMVGPTKQVIEMR